MSAPDVFDIYHNYISDTVLGYAIAGDLGASQDDVAEIMDSHVDTLLNEARLLIWTASRIKIAAKTGGEDLYRFREGLAAANKRSVEPADDDDYGYRDAVADLRQKILRGVESEWEPMDPFKWMRHLMDSDDE